MARFLISVNAASVALLAFAAVVAATHGPIVSNPEFAVGGAHHPMQKGHHHLRHPSKQDEPIWGSHQFTADEPKKEDEGAKEDDEGAKEDKYKGEPGKAAEHADASHDEHGGKPGSGGDPMVPRTHEHGDIEADHNYGWSYEFPEHWEKSYKFCSGKLQSPVNLPTKVKKASDAGDGNLSTAVSYGPLGDLHIDNNGHNLQVNGAFGNITLLSSMGRIMYSASQFNFHFPSEHKVDGKHATGEIQIVHQKVGAEGMDGLVIVAILLEEVMDEVKETEVKVEEEFVDQGARLCHVCNELSFMSNLGFPAAKMCSMSGAPAPAPAVALITSSQDWKISSDLQLKREVEADEKEREEEEDDERMAVEHEKKKEALITASGDPPSAPAPGAPGAAAAVPFAPAPAPPPELPALGRSLPIDGEIDLSAAFGYEFGGGYYHYKGSLTTPPCAETVDWLVLDRPAAVTPEMVEAFKKLFPDPANARPTQRRNGRKIVWSKEEVPGEAPAKSATQTIHAGVGLLTILYVMAANA